ncbi:MAG TPA: hypothetical protein VFX50_15005 [Gemmatimonadales bacterium]|nr:hypothetical protein [Gemmatimonadales bacterium]
MAAIVPRWEWRTFDSEDRVAVGRFAALTAERVQESDEVYLLSPLTDANVKVRDDLMDIKTLEAVGPTGLEQWRPIMKASFPLTADAVQAVCSALGVTPPAALREATTLEELVESLEGQGVRAVPVHKLRLRYVIDGAMAEMTEVITGGKRVRSVAIESEDTEQVNQALEEMDLLGITNTSYPRGLKALVGMAAVRA